MGYDTHDCDFSEPDELLRAWRIELHNTHRSDPRYDELCQWIAERIAETQH